MKKFNGKKRLKRLNGSLEWHMVGPHAFPHEASAFIYIYIDWLIEFTNVYLEKYVSKKF